MPPFGGSFFSRNCSIVSIPGSPDLKSVIPLPASSFSSLFLAGYMPYWSTNLISSFSLNAGPDYGYGEPGEEDIVCNYQVDHTLDENGYVTGLRMTNDAGESWTFSIVYE